MNKTSDTPEPSLASAGSHGDPLSVCCRHLANSQAIIERKNAEIERLRLTDEEREAIAAGLGALERLYEDSPPISKPICAQHAPTLRGLLERTK